MLTTGFDTFDKNNLRGGVCTSLIGWGGLKRLKFFYKEEWVRVGKLVFCCAFIMEGKGARRWSGGLSDYNYGPGILNPVRQ